VNDDSGTDHPIYEGERVDYTRAVLLEADAPDDPFVLLRAWLDDAVRAEVTEPTAMIVATVDAAGAPHTRTVLLRRISDDGLAFFTNRSSAKGVELAVEPRCALQLGWLDLQRQIRIEGVARHVPDVESDEYHASRPRGSQVSAWASPQSRPVRGRDEIDELVDAAARRFEGVEEVPRPPFWGGYEVVPHQMEFWQGRPSRLHDRLRYRLDSGTWVRQRLAP